jgi:hypothetical protein
VAAPSETSYPIVDILLNRGDPVLLATGGAADSPPEKYRRQPRLPKPFDRPDFEQMAMSVLGAAG